MFYLPTEKGPLSSHLQGFCVVAVFKSFAEAAAATFTHTSVSVCTHDVEICSAATAAVTVVCLRLFSVTWSGLPACPLY